MYKVLSVYSQQPDFENKQTKNPWTTHIAFHSLFIICFTLGIVLGVLYYVLIFSM